MTKALVCLAVFAALGAWSAAVLAQSDPLLDLIRRYSALHNQGQYAEATTLAVQAVNMGRQEFGDGDPKTASLLRDVAELNRAQGHYREAEHYYLQALTIMENTLGMVHPDVAKLLIELAEIHRLQGRFTDAARLYTRAMEIDAHVLSKRGFESGLRTSGLSQPGSRMINSVYDFFDRKNRELADYGRYTYVFIPGPQPRNAKFLEVLLQNTRPGDSLEFDRKKLNVFYVPVRENYQDAARDLSTRQLANPGPAAAPIAGAYYDHDYAVELLSRLCAIPATETPIVCGSALSQGPYLVTLVKRFSEHEANPGPYLALDLSKIHPEAFGKFIDAVKVQVKHSDFTDLEKIEETRLAVLNTILQVADWLTWVKPAVSEISQLVIPKGK